MFIGLSPLIDYELLRAETMYYLFTFAVLVYSTVRVYNEFFKND